MSPARETGLTTTNSGLPDEIVAYYLECDPVRATFLGWPDFYDQLADYSPAGLERQRAAWSAFQRQLRAVDPGLLSPEHRLDHRAAEALVESELFRIERWQPFRKDPSVYAEELMTGIAFLVTRGDYTPEQRVAGMKARFSSFPRVVDEGRAAVEKAPLPWIEYADEILEGAEEVLDALAGATLVLLPTDEQALEEAEIDEALAVAIAAVSDFRLFLGELRQTADVVEIAMGKQAFEDLLWVQHRWQYTVDELVAIGKDAVAQCQWNLDEYSRAKGTGKDWRTLVDEAAVRRPAPDKLVSVYGDAVARARNHVLNFHLAPLPPRDNLQVLPTPEFERAGTPFAAYWDPAVFATDGFGSFLVTVPRGTTAEVEEAMREHSYGAIESTVVHEAYPGHQLQVSWAAAAPSRIRRVMEVMSMAEGWALYGERLMAESGFLQGDALLFHLRDRLLRAARIQADVGMQTGLMTFDEAVAFMQQEVFLSEAAAEDEVRWYSREPTTPLSYYLGMLELERLRDDVKAAEGAAFNLVGFHSRFLRCGTLPIPLIRNRLLEEIQPSLGDSGAQDKEVKF